MANFSSRVATLTCMVPWTGRLRAGDTSVKGEERVQTKGLFGEEFWEGILEIILGGINFKECSGD